MAVIFVRGQAMEVADHTATVLAGLGAESYMRLGELWNQDQAARYASAGQQQQQPAPAPQHRPAAARVSIDQEAQAREERRETIAAMAKQRGQTSWSVYRQVDTDAEAIALGFPNLATYRHAVRCEIEREARRERLEADAQHEARVAERRGEGAQQNSDARQFFEHLNRGSTVG